MTDAEDELNLADPRQLPPGQRLEPTLQPRHYGRVPRLRLETWTFTVGGATQTGRPSVLSWDQMSALGRTLVRADHHCVSRHSALDLTWSGVSARAVVALAPPDDRARYVLVYAAYGYSSTVTVDDLLSPRTVFATHLDGAPLTPEHGWPMRLVLPHLYGWKGPKWVVGMEYSAEPRRGFWEDRGYHLGGDVWREERYAHQE